MAVPSKHFTAENAENAKEDNRREDSGSKLVVRRDLPSFSSFLVFLCVLRVLRGETSYHAKWAKALLESAILMVFSRLVMASPSRR